MERPTPEAVVAAITEWHPGSGGVYSRDELHEIYNGIMKHLRDTAPADFRFPEARRGGPNGAFRLTDEERAAWRAENGVG